MVGPVLISVFFFHFQTEKGILKIKDNLEQRGSNCNPVERLGSSSVCISLQKSLYDLEAVTHLRMN